MGIVRIINRAFLELGIPETQLGVTSNVDTVRQAVALVNRTGRSIVELNTFSSWFLVETSVTTVVNQSGYVLDIPFSRILPETFFDRTNQRKVSGGLLPSRWQDIKGRGYLYTDPPYKRFRILSNGDGRVKIVFLDTIETAGEQIYFEYLTKNWVYNPGPPSVSKNEITADTDETIIDEDLLSLGLKVRLLSLRGQDITIPAAEYKQSLDRFINAANSSPVLDLTPHDYSDAYLLGPQNIDWGRYGY